MNSNILAIIRLAASGAILNQQDRMELILFLEGQAKEKFKIGIWEVNGDTYRKIQDLAKYYNNGKYDLRAGEGNPKINAIKLLREAAGCSLKEAKDTIESIKGFEYVPQQGW